VEGNRRITMANFEDLIGKTIVSIDGLYNGSDQVTFRTSDDKMYRMYHYQD
jgi:hypothetical protein